VSASPTPIVSHVEADRASVVRAPIAQPPPSLVGALAAVVPASPLVGPGASASALSLAGAMPQASAHDFARHAS